MKGKKSVHDRIEELIGPKVDRGEDEEDADETTKAKFDKEFSDDDDDSDHNDPTDKRSQLRAANAPNLADIDQRYRGKKVSRKSLEDDLDAKEMENAEWGDMLLGDDDDEEGSEDLGEEEEEDIDDEEEQQTDPEDEKSRLFSQVEDEVAKGKAIQAQINRWEGLLEVRIQLQKMLTRVNKFPQHSQWSEFIEQGDESYKREVKAAQHSLSGVLEDLMKLQASAAYANAELMAEDEDDAFQPPAKKSKSEGCLSERHDALKSFRDATITKWGDRTRLLASANSFSGFETSALAQIERILADKGRLVKRTQTKRSAYRCLGKTDTNDNEDPEIFDDDDFYHQLLRELIDRKTGSETSASSELGRRWLQMQRLRTKAKKQVDTRASKGRKTRYDIHAKLVNFMAPETSSSVRKSKEDYSTSWKDEAKNELFSSLFGQSVTASKQVDDEI